jgi:hypothetical protein
VTADCKSQFAANRRAPILEVYYIDFSVTNIVLVDVISIIMWGNVFSSGATTFAPVNRLELANSAADMAHLYFIDFLVNNSLLIGEI